MARSDPGPPRSVGSDEPGVGPVAEIGVVEFLEPGPRQEALDEPVPLHLDRVEDFPFRFLLKEERAPPLQGREPVDAVREALPEGKGTLEVALHEMAPAPGASRRADEGLAVQQ